MNHLFMYLDSAVTTSQTSGVFLNEYRQCTYSYQKSWFDKCFPGLLILWQYLLVGFGYWMASAKPW